MSETEAAAPGTIDDGEVAAAPSNQPTRRPTSAAVSRESASESSDGVRMSPAAARRFARRNLGQVALARAIANSPELLLRRAPGAASDRRSGPLLPPHPSSLDIPRRNGGGSIFDMYSLTYVADPDPNLLCPICHDPLVDPVTTPCDHTFCYRCLRRSIASSPSGTACPIDRDLLSWLDCFSAARLIRTQLNSLMVKCPYHGRGCNRELRREVVESHATTECRYRELCCPDTNCDKKLRNKPKDEQCPHREVACTHCDAKIDEADNDVHLLSCSKAKTRCQGCWQLIQRSQLDSHRSLECDGAEIGCPYQDVGCPIRAIRGEMSAHTIACAFHPDTPSGIVIRTQRETIQSYTDLGSQLRDVVDRQNENNRQIDEVIAALNRRGGGGGDSLINDNRTMQDLDAGFEEVHQNLTHLEARQSMWTMNQVMPIREEVTELRNNINMIRMHVNWLLNRSREEGRIRAANNTASSSTIRRGSSSDAAPILPERRRSSGTETDLPRLLAGFPSTCIFSPSHGYGRRASMDPNEQPSWTGGDAPDKEKMDQIRARRLAKLGSSAPRPSESKDPENEAAQSSTMPTPKPQSGEAPTPKPRINITPAPKPSLPSSNPFTQLGVQNTKREDPSGSSGSFRPHRKRSAAEIDDGAAATPAPRKPNPQQTESDADYAHRVLTQIFRITVDPHHMTDAQGQRLIFVPNLNQELNESGDPLKLSTSVLDQAIIEACGNLPLDKPLFGYLLLCWKRASKAASTAKNVSDVRSEVHEEAKRLCISNCLFSLTMPALYGREANADHDTLAPFLLRGISDEGGLDFDFIREAIKRFDDDEAVPALFNDAMVNISNRLSTLSLGDDYKPYVQALLTYTRFPVLISNLAEHSCFNMAQSAPGIEKHTILGPFFRISPLQPEAIKSYFPGPRSLDRTRIANAQESLRIVLRAHQDDLFVIANAFIRAGPDTRSRTLNWFAYIMNMNHKRRAMQVDPREVASDGFMLNVTTIMDRFCEPFMDTDFSKVDKIDVKYFKRQPRVDIKDETKLNADQVTADKYYSEKESGESNFISEAFFLALAAHHYGSEALNSQLKNLDREIKYLEKNIKAMEAERPKVANMPHQLRLFEETLKRHTNVLEKTIALKYAIEGALLDERMQSTSLRFMRYVAVWLLRLVTGSDYKPGKEVQAIKLPLSMENSEAFACLPEYALQNIVDNFKFVFRWLPKILPSAVGDEMIALCITFLRSSEFIKNPYLKSSLVSLLFSGTWPFMHLKKGVLGDQLVSLQFANDYLLHALMKFYIECESTGANSAFYDKFNIRYEIFQVIKCVWVNDVYKDQLTRESKVNRSFFVQFVNMLLNDATYVLDEAFTKFPKMRSLERELEDQSLSTEDRQKKEEELQTLGNQATSYMQLANETLEMMKLFTQALSESFTMPEIVSRLASMLNYNLETLAGKKAAAELSVSNKDKYHFRPIQLLSDFVDIYLHLGYSPIFVEAVAADGRSYKPEVLDRVTRILTSKHQKDASEIAKWEKIKAKFLEAKQQLDQAEIDLGDIPAEFEDPIMGDLMKDPVLLPSKHIVDRSTIVQHLLSDPKDPFTRQPMTVDDAIPQTELKEKIDAWRAEKVAAAKAKLVPDAMDTTEG
ncbi:Ubiquitin conjugation factor E4 [Tolypocladium paradoxum]|uniref:Ubiquitin conjugation factor E4 n=1 Tax=Tolypocladium paradoxum TaxID=94208 RepID=A0A2S4KWI6_9HYPO|nr:Ubiquitin conjugation factor E4 [Tolypocladium paradoxum]